MADTAFFSVLWSKLVRYPHRAPPEPFRHAARPSKGYTHKAPREPSAHDGNNTRKEVAMKIILEILTAILIAIPLALLVIFDLPGLGILLAIGLLGYAYVAKKNHEAAPARHRQPLVMSGPEHHNRAA